MTHTTKHYGKLLLLTGLFAAPTAQAAVIYNVEETYSSNGGNTNIAFTIEIPDSYTFVQGDNYFNDYGGSGTTVWENFSFSTFMLDGFDLLSAPDLFQVTQVNLYESLDPGIVWGDNTNPGGASFFDSFFLSIDLADDGDDGDFTYIFTEFSASSITMADDLVTGGHEFDGFFAEEDGGYTVTVSTTDIPAPATYLLLGSLLPLVLTRKRTVS